MFGPGAPPRPAILRSRRGSTPARPSPPDHGRGRLAGPRSIDRIRQKADAHVTAPQASDEPPELRALSAPVDPECSAWSARRAPELYWCMRALASVSTAACRPARRSAASYTADLPCKASTWMESTSGIYLRSPTPSLVSPTAPRSFRTRPATDSLFDSAPPSSPYRALALLLLEGAIQMLTTNWDTCIERAVAAPDRIVTVMTSGERAQAQVHSLLKLHGCGPHGTVAGA